MPNGSISVALALLAAAVPANAATCTPARLSLDEATRLVNSIPEILAEKRRRAEVSVQRYEPQSGNTDFYYFVLHTDDLPSTLLQNGLIGYYSVSKVSGRVVNVADQDVVGNDLRKLQIELRAQHCITSEIISRSQDVEP